MHRARELAVLGAALVLLAAAPAARAQAPAGPITPPANLQQPKKPALRVNVDWVSTPVTVRNSKGELVLNLAEKDFRVLEDGVEQKIEHFDLGGDPLSVVVVVENSSRVEPLLPAVRKTGILLSQEVMPGDVEAALVSYDDTPVLRQSFTTSGDAVERAMEHLPEGLSGAALFDALSEGVDLLSRQPKNRRRIILAMAEPVDTGSESKLGEVLRAAQLQNVTIYSVGLSTTAAELRATPREPTSPYPPGISPMPGPPGIPQTPSTTQIENTSADLGALAIWIVQHVKESVKDHVLEIAAKATGGEHVAAFKDHTIEKAMIQIAGELHAQYTLGYRPTSGDLPGFHKISVNVDRSGLKVLARPGYYLE
ncbi:MAG TPA: VWA domain-containing protein [Candidatus Acidoferrales bacterium]|nr:VWA domain-containing protein [Candidatus Acidoferrales bacterium]